MESKIQFHDGFSKKVLGRFKTLKKEQSDFDLRVQKQSNILSSLDQRFSSIMKQCEQAVLHESSHVRTGLLTEIHQAIGRQESVANEKVKLIIV